MTADLRKNVNFGHFTVLHISQPNEQIFTFQVSSGHLVVIFMILKDFPESPKIWRFSWPRTCEKLSFLGISQFSNFSPKWANIHISSVLWSTGGDFHHFKSLFRKSKELKFFMNENLRKKCQFWAFYSFAYFSNKWANIHISSVQWSSGGDFHHFKRLSRKSKNLKIFMTADLRKIVIFGHFTVLHISHPNEQIFTFQVSCGQLVVIFIILKAFSESRKNWRFSWPRTCEKMSILGISQFCIFLKQMSKYSHFKCPVVIWWRFSSF